MIQKKICMLGPTGVGKTSLVKQYVEGIFSEKYLTSIGVKIDKKQVERNGSTVQLMLWDMEGIDRYCGFNPRYLRGASSFFIIVDQTRYQSLVEGIEVYQLAREANPKAHAVLVVNKVDLPATSHWSRSELEPYENHFANVFYTSAKTGESVEDMFKFVAFPES